MRTVAAEKNHAETDTVNRPAKTANLPTPISS